MWVTDGSGNSMRTRVHRESTDGGYEEQERRVGGV